MSWAPDERKHMLYVLDEIAKRAHRIAIALEKIAERPAPSTPASPSGPIATSIDLSTADADEPIRSNPKRWKGESIKGKRMSECSHEALDVLAAALEFKADQEAADPERKKWERGSRLSAAKARAWARQKRAEGTASGPRDDGFVE